jgi:hypothetical protein
VQPAGDAVHGFTHFCISTLQPAGRPDVTKVGGTMARGYIGARRAAAGLPPSARASRPFHPHSGFPSCRNIHVFSGIA